MTVNIIGCGETTKNWDGSGVSIGVNDCWKYGKPTQSLMLLNHNTSFSPERMKTITSSTPQIMYTHLNEWQKYFPISFKKINIEQWSNGKLSKDKIFYSKTSPFCAISLAYCLGYDKIILWGVDFVDHPYYSPGKHNFEGEKLRYHALVASLAKEGVKVYAGSYGSTLGLPVYKRDE